MTMIACMADLDNPHSMVKTSENGRYQMWECFEHDQWITVRTK